MKKQTILLLLVTFLVSLACQFLFPPSVANRDGVIVSACTDLVNAFRGVQPGGAPQALLETGIKQGGEFDANEYFRVLTNISMQDGYVLDYVYHVDGLGAFPILYARPANQPAYVSANDLPADFERTDYHNHLAVEDVEQGYFEFAALNIMGGQFYLDWHANYNDTEIVCDSDAVDAIIADISDGNFGIPFDSSQRRQARAMENVEPLVKLTDDSARVEIIIFTKWGGFYRWTYTISRSVPHTIVDVKSENLVEYDCGIAF
jgi:hypothetical protein